MRVATIGVGMLIELNYLIEFFECKWLKPGTINHAILPQLYGC